MQVVNKRSKFYKSVILKSIVLLLLAMTVILLGAIYTFTSQLGTQAIERNFTASSAKLQQISISAQTEMKQFGDKIALMAKASEIQSMDPIVAAGYLKGYNISSLFISGEIVSLYDREHNLICDNSMVGGNPVSYPVDFGKITPHRISITPWYREDAISPPKRAFANIVEDRAHGDGSLIASFSIRRLWTNMQEFKAGKNGYLVAFNGNKEILFHPENQKWTTGVHKIGELGLDTIQDPKTFTIEEPTFITLDKKDFLINYIYDQTYDLGLVALQPKAEIDETVNTVKTAGKILLFITLLVILLIAFWLYVKLANPLARLINHIDQISSGNLDIAEIPIGKREDEIGLLSKAFNSMHSTIKRQIRELNAHRELLEQEVRERTQELEFANKKLDLMSRTDELTGLPNRRDIQDSIKNEIGRSERTHKPFCFIFIDIDHFKQVNDTYGHKCGDVVLQSVATTVRNLLRKYDIIARYGGEEFLTLLPETELAGAIIVAERFRSKIENMTIKYGDLEIKVTITLGVAQYDERLGADRSIQLADRALYEGKEGGRNRVVVWRPEQTLEADYQAAAIEQSEERKQQAKLAAEKPLTPS